MTVEREESPAVLPRLGDVVIYRTTALPQRSAVRTGERTGESGGILERAAIVVALHPAGMSAPGVVVNLAVFLDGYNDDVFWSACYPDTPRSGAGVVHVGSAHYDARGRYIHSWRWPDGSAGALAEKRAWPADTEPQEPAGEPQEPQEPEPEPTTNTANLRFPDATDGDIALARDWLAGRQRTLSDADALLRREEANLEAARNRLETARREYHQQAERVERLRAARDGAGPVGEPGGEPARHAAYIVRVVICPACGASVFTRVVADAATRKTAAQVVTAACPNEHVWREEFGADGSHRSYYPLTGQAGEEPAAEPGEEPGA